MTTTETEFDLGNFPKEEEPENPYDDDVIKDLLGTIEVLEKTGWTGRGWRRGNRICILNAVSAAENGGVPQHTWSGIPSKVLGYLHKAISPKYHGAATPEMVDEAMADPGASEAAYRSRSYLAGDIMGWNDGSGMRNRAPVVKAIKEAIELRKEDLKRVDND